MFQVAEARRTGSGKKVLGKAESHVRWGRFQRKRNNGVQTDLPTSPRHPGAQELSTMAQEATWDSCHHHKEGRSEERGPSPVSSDGHHLGVRGCSPEPPGSQARARPREADKLLSHLPRLLPPTKCKSHSSGEGLDLFPPCPLWSVFFLFSAPSVAPSSPTVSFTHSIPISALNWPMGSSFTTTGSGVLSLSQAFFRLYKENLSWSNLYLCCCWPTVSLNPQ